MYNYVHEATAHKPAGQLDTEIWYSVGHPAAADLPPIPADHLRHCWTRRAEASGWHRLPGHAAVLGTVVARMAPNSQEPTLTLPPTCCSPLLTSAMAAEGCSEFAWPYSQEPTLTLPPSCCSPLLKSAMAAEGCSEVVTSLNSAKYLTSDWWRAGLPPPSPHHNVEECQAVHVFVSRPGPKTA